MYRLILKQDLISSILFIKMNVCKLILQDTKSNELSLILNVIFFFHIVYYRNCPSYYSSGWGSLYTSCYYNYYYVAPAPSEEDSGLSTPVLIGIAAGGALLLILAIILIVYCYRKRKGLALKGVGSSNLNGSGSIQELPRGVTTILTPAHPPQPMIFSSSEPARPMIFSS